MQNLPRLGVHGRLSFKRLRGGEELQDTFRDPGANPERLERCDDAVAPKHRAEPRDSSIWVMRLWVANRHHFNISRGAFNPIVETVIGAGDQA